MRKVLFVDDEVQVLDGLRDRLRRHRNHLDMRFAVGGHAALGEMERDEADVVVTDMRMPDMDGATLLERVRERWPAAVRIVLSGQTELGQELRVLRVAHLFLSKPCDADELREVIDRTCALRDVFVDPAILAVVGRATALPSPPESYERITAALASPDAAPADVVGVVKKDVAMTAKIIQLVNSAFFGLGRKTVDLQEAIAYLGIETLRALVLFGGVLLEFSPPRPIKGFSIEALERHSASVAAVAAAMAPAECREVALTGGMLHDVGKLVLAHSAPAELADVMRLAGERGCPMHQAEVELLGTTHAEIGAYLLSLWGMPHPVVETVVHHHLPARAAGRIAVGPAAIHVADAAVHAAHQPDAPWVPKLIDDEGLASAGFADRLGDWRERASSVLDREQEQEQEAA